MRYHGYVWHKRIAHDKKMEYMISIIRVSRIVYSLFFCRGAVVRASKTGFFKGMPIEVEGLGLYNDIKPKGAGA